MKCSLCERTPDDGATFNKGDHYCKQCRSDYMKEMRDKVKTGEPRRSYAKVRDYVNALERRVAALEQRLLKK